MASAAQKLTRAGSVFSVSSDPDPSKAQLEAVQGAGVPPSVLQRYESYKSLMDRATSVFGDGLTASRWLSMPSADLDRRVPLQVAQSVDYDAAQVEAIFEPIFIRIEHGIYV